MKERLNFFHARNDHWIGRCNEIFGGLILLLRIHTKAFVCFEGKMERESSRKRRKRPRKGPRK